MTTKENIEQCRDFLRGITKPDTWIHELCDLALKGLEAQRLKEDQQLRSLRAFMGDSFVDNNRELSDHAIAEQNRRVPKP